MTEMSQWKKTASRGSRTIFGGVASRYFMYTGSVYFKVWTWWPL